MSKHRVLSFKPHLRLEWRGQDGQSETEQPDHSASLGDSITSSTRIRFSVHTEAHLGRVLKSYAHYYNGVRTHRSLNKDAPVSRAVQRTGVIRSRAILGGLHHHYARI
jgi:hypothetical protein